ncbi:MAG: translocation/assembly module TamB domain-containing protein [Haliscomenobacter sp.]|nr:translocation/assembly module TamB domain-containing protein [Haliscomenobacter sp.]
MNKQVFGLIVAGQFLPADFSLQGSQIIYNTVSEFLSNQLSLLITELFSDLVGEGQALSSVDFDIAYNQYQSANLSQGGNLNRGNELQVSLRQNYFDNRLSILVGGNIDLGNNWRANTGATGAFIGNDVAIEYQLVDDRSLKLRIYQKLQPDISGRILQIGAGLSYRKEFDSFGEFLKSIRVGLKKPKPGPVPPANKNN